ncbi:MAG: GNAT family N-acetyltransferase [Verrucomicrobiales bacterium]|nr:GNAT family N-acetyltransferase [Verrucomicrobiales bacterium]
MKKSDWPEVANLIYLSTNHWYQTQQGISAFSGGPDVCLLFCQVYEDIDPDCCLIAKHEQTGMILGSCFYHPRETHVSLGIMNVHPNYFGAGVAGALLNEIIQFSQQRERPLRLVSSALNLDSYSLYNRKGFVPTAIYQDMVIKVPSNGIDTSNFDLSRIRDADLEDVSAMGALEFEVSGISRERDYCYFIENDLDIWHVSISEDKNGAINGFLVSVNHPGSNMLGPGISKNADTAANLIVSELNQHQGRSPIVLVPADQRPLVDAMYSIGAKNCELHFAQVLGDQQPINGIVMPTFMPETG